MRISYAIVAVMSVSLVTPVWAGAHSDTFVSATLTKCKTMVRDKHVAKADSQAEVDKCLNNPGAYK
jgi:hypothetical protein